jgi:SAM-dependent methyltransferase
MDIRKLQKNWEGLAAKDPMWAVLTNPMKKSKKWDAATFYESGEYEVEMLLALLGKCWLTLPDTHLAVDFGCGLGRLSRGLAARFDRVLGIDISTVMTELAKEYNKNFTNIGFVAHAKPDLSLMADNKVSFLLSIITLQHIPDPFAIEYVGEFLRVLKKGGLAIFQIPSQDKRELTAFQKFRKWVRIKERLAMMGIGNGFNMDMFVISEQEVQAKIANNGGALLRKFYTNHTVPNYDGKLIASKEEMLASGFVSTLYIVQKV